MASRSHSPSLEPGVCRKRLVAEPPRRARAVAGVGGRWKWEVLWKIFKLQNTLAWRGEGALHAKGDLHAPSRNGRRECASKVNRYRNRDGCLFAQNHHTFLFRSSGLCVHRAEHLNTCESCMWLCTLLSGHRRLARCGNLKCKHPQDQEARLDSKRGLNRVWKVPVCDAAAKLFGGLQEGASQPGFCTISSRKMLDNLQTQSSRSFDRQRARLPSAAAAAEGDDALLWHARR
eukprot:1717838-Pleurochrysis_carterae.AAC.1